MSSPAEEKALRVSALKASGTLQKKIAEARNSLTKMLKKGVMNQEIACSMHRMLTELRGYKISEIEKCFNELWKTFTRELLTACNESLSTLTPPISFNFELFPGPEEALAAAEAAAEAEKKRKQLMLERQIKSREDDDRREQIGLAARQIQALKIHPHVGCLLLQHLNGELPTDEGAQQNPNCFSFQQGGGFENIMRLVLEVLEIRKKCSKLSRELKETIYMVSTCMKNSGQPCNECAILSICFQLVIKHSSETIFHYKMWKDLKVSIICTGLQLPVDPKFHSFLIQTCIEVENLQMYSKTKRNLFDAISNLGANRNEVIGVLTDYPTFRSSPEEIEKTKGSMNEKFIDWKKWYESVEYSSSSDPPPFSK